MHIKHHLTSNDRDVSVRYFAYSCEFWTSTCAFRCSCIWLWVEATGQPCIVFLSPQVLFKFHPPTPLFSFGKSVSHWLGGWQVGWLTGYSMSPRQQPVSASPALGFQVHITAPGFHKHQCQGLISGPHSCRESTWLTDPSPQPSEVTWTFHFRSDSWLALAGQAFYYRAVASGPHLTFL